MTLSDILATLRRIQHSLQREYGVTSIAVFGSAVRGEMQPGSDVDILVEVDPSISWRFVDLAEAIESELAVKIDLVSRRALKPALLDRIEEELVYV